MGSGGQAAATEPQTRPACWDAKRDRRCPDGMANGVLAGVSPVQGLYASLVGRVAGGLTAVLKVWESEELSKRLTGVLLYPATEIVGAGTHNALLDVNTRHVQHD